MKNLYFILIFLGMGLNSAESTYAAQPTHTFTWKAPGSPYAPSTKAIDVPVTVYSL